MPFIVWLLFPQKLYGTVSTRESIINVRYLELIRFFVLIILIIGISTIKPILPNTDFSAYVDMYNYQIDTGYVDSYLLNREFGYRALNTIFSWIDTPSEIFFGIISGITWFIFLKRALDFKFSFSLMFFIVLSSGLFYWTFNGVRQALSLAIFFFSINYIVNKRLTKYVACIIIGSLFHSSCLLLLPLYLLNRVSFNQSQILIVYLFSIMFSSYFNVVEHLKSLIIVLGSYIPIIDGYSSFLNREQFQLSDDSGKNTGLGIILSVIINLYMIYKYPVMIACDSRLKVYYNIYFIGLVFSTFLAEFEIVGRFMVYFLVPYSLLLALTIFNAKGKYEQLISLAILFLLMCLFVFTTFRVYG